MRWDTIVDLAKESLGERSSNFFPDTKLRVVGARIQAEIASAARCVESNWVIRTIPCAAVATSNITLTTATTAVDGVTLATGDNVLVTEQTTSSSNGVYVVPASGAWTRLPSVASGTAGRNLKNVFAIVEGGTTYEETVWEMTGIPKFVNTSAMTWTWRPENDVWAYNLPPGFISIVDIKANTRPLDQTTAQPSTVSYPKGQPTHFFMDGSNVGLYPRPASEMEIAFAYRRTTPTCAFQFWYDTNLSGASATSCVVRVVDNNFTITSTLTGGTSGTVSLNLVSNYTTVGDLSGYINSTLRTLSSSGIQPFGGCRAVLDPDIDYYTPSTKLCNIYDSEDCYEREKFQYIMIEPEVPNEAQDIIVQGIVERMKMKDRESANSAYQQAKYSTMLDRFVKKYRRRDISVALDNINNKNSGNTPYIDPTLTVYLP